MEAPPAPPAPPEEFFQGLEKYFAKDLEGAKKVLTGDDLFSKSLMVLIDVKQDDDGSKGKEIEARINAMDFKGNDIALMFCVLSQEYALHTKIAENLLLKRFGKKEKVIQKEEEMPELEPVEAPKATVDAPKATVEAPKATVEAPKEAPNTTVEAPKTTVETTVDAPAPVNQAGGKRVTRKASLGKKKKRVSRGKA